jgi:hypothetical protein
MCFPWTIKNKSPLIETVNEFQHHFAAQLMLDAASSSQDSQAAGAQDRQMPTDLLWLDCQHHSDPLYLELSPCVHG